MPPRRSNKKKKVKSRDRNAKATCCHGCSKQLEKDNFIYCVCTQVCFCTKSCQEEHPHDDCNGPPETEFDMGVLMRSIPELSSSGGAFADVESLETVQRPIMEYIRSKGQGSDSRFSVWDLAEWADEGDDLQHQACAYVAGSRFKLRMLGDTRWGQNMNETKLRVSNEGENDIPVLESQELAYKYFEKAARLGHGLAMQSLATCFTDGIGCKSNLTRRNHWLWRASLQNSGGAFESLEQNNLLSMEITNIGMLLENAMTKKSSAPSFLVVQPNLGSLFLAFHDVVQRENYSLPPFAGSRATATVNNPVQQMAGHPRTPLIGGDAAKDAAKQIRKCKALNKEISFGYGRRGIAKQATAQSVGVGAATRAFDNQIFYVPPLAACDERVDIEMITKWREQMYELALSGTDSSACAYYAVCVHNEGKEGQNRGGFCEHCMIDAMERLDAIARGAVVLSLDEDLEERGQAAIFQYRDGSLKIETWKRYSEGEAECVLAILAASGMPSYVSPLFIAQDPNFLWPIIAYHGSVRAAVEFVAPHIDWSEIIGPARENAEEQVPVIPGSRPGKYLRKCGNGFCCNLEHYRSETFKYCSKCNRRKYCSPGCQRDDWALHKLECGSNANNIEANLRLDDSGDEDQVKTSKYKLELEEGQDCVVHGLKAKPHYNGKVGLVVGSSLDGRIAITLKSDGNLLSIKPDNVHCIGVFCRKRKKKSRVFECRHGLEVCSECYFDFTTINRLAKLKYDGQDILTNAAAIKQCEDIYFSSSSLKGESGVHSFNEGWPVECIGMEEYPRERFILKALVEADCALSLLATVAQSAFITYGGAFTNSLLRAETKLEDVAQML